jgi:hypothetical protein
VLVNVVVFVAGAYIRAVAYGSLLERGLSPWELNMAWCQSILSVCLLLLLGHLIRRPLYSMLGRSSNCKDRATFLSTSELYIRFCSAFAAFLTNSVGLVYSIELFVGLDAACLASATALTVPICDALVRIGIWRSIGESSAGIKYTLMEQMPSDSPLIQAQKTKERIYQLRVFVCNVVVLIAPFLVKTQFTMLETYLGMLVAHAVAQLLSELTAESDQSLKPLRVIDCQWYKVAKLLLVGAEGGLATMAICELFCAADGCDSRHQALLWASVGLGALAYVQGQLFSLAFGVQVGTKTAEQHPASKCVAAARARVKPRTFMAFLAIVIQGMFLWAMLRDDYSQNDDDMSVGLQNIRAALASPWAVTAGILGILAAITAVWSA